jgi:pantoate--beta-alanine ligase
MILIRTITELRKFRETAFKGKSIGFVPTMGALHSGHLSLIERSKAENDLTIVSIYVNPTQFNESDDFKNYPRTEEADLQLMRPLQPDYVLIPQGNEMYGESPKLLTLDLNGLDSVMEGRFRKGHFQGVVTIVDKFFSLILPTRAYFGQKDFQQLAIIKHLAKLRYPTLDIVSCPIIREIDGLAMSSRNTRLTSEERTEALLLSRVLFELELGWNKIPFDKLLSNAKAKFKNTQVDLEYLEIVDSKTLISASNYTHQEMVACIAARVGRIRLIDNILLKG